MHCKGIPVFAKFSFCIMAEIFYIHALLLTTSIKHMSSIINKPYLLLLKL